MGTAGIICEYNPMHSGHMKHIEETKRRLDCAIVCVMSGNFVQRGDFAVFSKHARAETAVKAGADLVLELPTPYVLSSAEGFAKAGVCILDQLGICDYISFGSESGDIEDLKTAADALALDETDTLTKEWLNQGLPYAQARQKAAEAVLGSKAALILTPNNLLGIEYIKAIYALGTTMTPMTVKREGDAHDSATGVSGSALRKMLAFGKRPWSYMPQTAALVCIEALKAGRAPVLMKAGELAMLSRLRGMSEADFAQLPGAVEGLDKRFFRYAATAPTVETILEKVKTKRYAMSRLRRMLLCACLGITAEDSAKPPPYLRVLAMNGVGRELLRDIGKRTTLPIITKPASAHELPARARELFYKEAAATDFYALAYPNEKQRAGAQEWTISPRVVE
ncbi:MAG: nucleotidyltransferase family protein [Oscillospiraceae bacterium]|nr:nucleotidyltransferase family protein [Oscillospiraceae bacterium]